MSVGNPSHSRSTSRCLSRCAVDETARAVAGVEVTTAALLAAARCRELSSGIVSDSLVDVVATPAPSVAARAAGASPRITRSRASTRFCGASGAPLPVMIFTRAVSKGEEHTEAATACSKQAVKRIGVARSAGAAGPMTNAASCGIVRLRNSNVPNEPAPAAKPAAMDASMPKKGDEGGGGGAVAAAVGGGGSPTPGTMPPMCCSDCAVLLSDGGVVVPAGALAVLIAAWRRVLMRSMGDVTARVVAEQSPPAMASRATSAGLSGTS